MSHYKKYSEHRHSRDVAKERVGGGQSGTQYDLSRIRDSGAPARGIPGRKSGSSIYGQGLQSGGDVKPFPISGKTADLNRLSSSQGIQSGRIAPSGGNVVPGPGRNPTTGGIKRNWIDRQAERDEMVYAKGGRVESKSEERREARSDRIQDVKIVKKAMRAHDSQLHGGKHTKLALKGGGRVPKITGGAESGIGRMELAKRAAARRGKV